VCLVCGQGREVGEARGDVGRIADTVPGAQAARLSIQIAQRRHGQDHYLATSGQIYYSDAHQLADYADGYHKALDQQLGLEDGATEMITEIYVPRNRLVDFLEAVADDFRSNGVNLIYGTIRLIERDEESFLVWATDRWACVIFNLCTVHSPAGLDHAASAFRRLIDLAVERGGSYCLTYHRWATRSQVETCYRRFAEFLRLKGEHDPEERFQSDWYRHYKAMFEDAGPLARLRAPAEP
jgi:hypothetical protein